MIYLCFFKSLFNIYSYLFIVFFGFIVFLRFFFGIWKSIVIIETNIVFNSRIELSWSIVFDNINLRFFFIILLISGTVFSFSSYYIARDIFINRFFWILFVFVLRIALLIFRRSILSLIVGWDGLGVRSFILIIYYQNSERIKSGVITLLTNRLGDGLLIVGSLIFLITGSIIYLDIFKRGFLISVLFFIGIFTKRAQYPFSTWLPAAIAAPTPVRTLVHSRTLVTAGIFLIFRFFFFFWFYNFGNFYFHWEVNLYNRVLGCLIWARCKKSYCIKNFKAIRINTFFNRFRIL